MYKSFRFQHAGLGGTFDQLHVGHKALIRQALTSAQQISLGVTTDDFTHTQTKILAHLIQTHSKRLENLQNYLKSIGAVSRVKLFSLNDAVGPTLTDPTIDCLVCTDHTYEGMLGINQLRRARELPELPIIKADLVKDASGLYISSTRIRQGLIDTQGHVYLYNLPQTIILTPAQRDQCVKPFGRLIAQKDCLAYIKSVKPPFIGVVGDQSLAYFIQQKLPVDLGIFDNRIQRQDSPLVAKLIAKDALRPVVSTVVNAPGTISFSAVSAITRAIKSTPSLLEVEGEEDLLVIPLILASPLQSLIFYGQPNTGLVVLTVTPHIKLKVVKLITT